MSFFGTVNAFRSIAFGSYNIFKDANSLTFKFRVEVFEAGKAHFGRGLNDRLTLAQEEGIDKTAVSRSELLASHHKPTLVAVSYKQTEKHNTGCSLI
jgi:hypothetical protein